MSTLKQRTLKNEILHIHADWLENNGQKHKARECRKQAILSSEKKYDERQTRIGRKYDRSVV